MSPPLWSRATGSPLLLVCAIGFLRIIIGALRSLTVFLTVNQFTGCHPDDDANSSSNGNPHGRITKRNSQQQADNNARYGASNHADSQVGEFLFGATFGALVLHVYYSTGRPLPFGTPHTTVRSPDQ